MKKLLISSHITIREALNKLDNTAEKVLIVVDEKNRLLGAITDGDIRRAILSGKQLADSVADIYNQSPQSISKANYSQEKAKALFLETKVELLPIVDHSHQVIDYITWDRLFSEEDHLTFPKTELDMEVVIMAGGKGERLRPFTTILPKPLIPIGQKTVIELIIDQFLKHQIKHFLISINHKGKIIKAYFDEIEKEYSVKFIQEKKPLGTAGSLKYLQGKLTRSFFVSNCDVIIQSDYSELVEFHKKNQNEITLVGAKKNFVIPYGICEVEEGGRLLLIKEKPEFDFLVNTGLYILEPSVLDLIPPNEFYNITDLIETLRVQKRKVGVFPINNDSWIDIGEWDKYRKSLKNFLI